MTAPLCFIDTETTGVHPDRRAWEIALIRRDATGTSSWLLQVADVDLSNADPFALNVGGFYERHVSAVGYFPLPHDAANMVTVASEKECARIVEEATRGAHLVGLVPSFDADVFDKMLRRHRLVPAWHYHLIDVGSMALGWLRGNVAGSGADDRHAEAATLPYRSDALALACGHEPAAAADRHTAMGDAKWTMDWYDLLTGVDPA